MAERTFIIDEYQKSRDYVKSPFRYAGGKFYALKHIMPFIDAVPHDEYREPFVGGGCIFFAKRKVKYNWINDLETELVKVYQAFSDKAVANTIALRLVNEIANKDRFEEVRDWNPTNYIDEVYRTFYLNRTAYCGIINKPAWGYKEKKSSPPQNWGKFITDVQPKLEGTRITNLDFSDVVSAPSIGDNVLMYLDPPYYKADQERAYTKPFKEADHIRLANMLRNTNYYFCLSYDDVEEVRDLYSWAYIHERKWLYNTANKKGEARDLGEELVITNYKVKRHDLFG